MTRHFLKDTDLSPAELTERITAVAHVSAA